MVVFSQADIIIVRLYTMVVGTNVTLKRRKEWLCSIVLTQQPVGLPVTRGPESGTYDTLHFVEIGLRHAPALTWRRGGGEEGGKLTTDKTVGPVILVEDTVEKAHVWIEGCESEQCSCLPSTCKNQQTPLHALYNEETRTEKADKIVQTNPHIDLKCEACRQLYRQMP